MLPDPETCRRLARDVAPRWIWFAGMLATSGGESARVTCVGSGIIGFDRYLPVGPLPDLTDPLTAAGALLVARQAWAPSCRAIWAWLSTCEGWIVTDGYGHRLGGGTTELEATIAAILAAPEKQGGSP